MPERTRPIKIRITKEIEWVKERPEQIGESRADLIIVAEIQYHNYSVSINAHTLDLSEADQKLPLSERNKKLRELFLERLISELSSI